uniref:UDP-N-acetylglucosamine transferase subunit ALG14 n=1 Tax=Ciona savignyi TaxID=51511 RepID=H2Z789_CIOSA
MEYWLWVLLLIIFVLVFMRLKLKSNTKQGKKRILAIAGSGGHTTELIRLLSSLPSATLERHYAVADTDRMSIKKITEFESKLSSKSKYFTYVIPRSREVAQSWLSTVFTTLFSFVYCIPVILKSKPDILLCNGPGTCIPICIAALIFKFLGFCRGEIIFVESICRVTSMSMSGKIIYPFSTKFFIQWPHLLTSYPKAIYLGGRIC